MKGHQLHPPQLRFEKYCEIEKLRNISVTFRTMKNEPGFILYAIVELR